MRKIKLESWKANSPEGIEVDETLIDILSVLISTKKPEEMPRGIDNFRLMNRLAKAFDKAMETKELILEESDYKFLSDHIVKDVPSVWGMSKNISKAIEEFLSAKQE